MRPSSSRPTFSSARAMNSSPVSQGRSPRLSTNADTRAFACASSPHDEHVQRAILGRAYRQNVGEHSVERLDDMRVIRSRLGDLLCAGTVVGDDEALQVGGYGVGDVNDDLASQRVPVLPHHRRRAGVRHGEDDDVPGRGGVEAVPTVAPPSAAANSLALAGSRPMISTALPPHERPGGQGAGHVPQADNADAAHGVPAFWSWTGRHARLVVVNGCVVDAVE